MSKTKSWQIFCCHMLRGIGASMALPFLEAMVPDAARSLAAGAVGEGGQPVRFAAFFMPNGVNHKDWDLPGNGSIGDLTPILSPLQAVKDSINVFSGLRNSSGGHNLGTSSFLTGRSPKKTPKPRMSMSATRVSTRSSEPPARTFCCRRSNWE